MSNALADRDRLRRLFDLRSEVYVSRGGTYEVDPYPTFHELRESGPVHAHSPHEPLGWTGPVFFQGVPYPDRPHFTAYDFETCSTILKDDEHFVTNVPPIGSEQVLPNTILFMDGPQHRSYRTLVQPSFIPAKVAWWLDKWIRGSVETLVDSIAPTGHADLNLELCAPVPMLTITGSFGLTDEEALQIREAVTSDMGDTTTMARLLIPIIAARREAPQDDLITVLTQAEMADEDGTVHRLNDIEILTFAFVLLAAGTGTTWKQMGITLYALLSNPEILDKVRQDPSLMRGVIEESVRWTLTDPAFSRFAIKDTELGGVQIPAGAVVHACLGSANRDPKRWERPDEFDPFRPMKPHLGFGFGPHTCLGMHVARMEMTHGINTVLAKLPNLRLDPNAPAPKVIGLYERGMDTVPVVFDAAGGK